MANQTRHKPEKVNIFPATGKKEKKEGKKRGGKKGNKRGGGERGWEGGGAMKKMKIANLKK